MSNINALFYLISINFPRHLFDPAHRETFESAHSVVLAIFAANAANASIVNNEHLPEAHKVSSRKRSVAQFAERMVPYYMWCLLEVQCSSYVLFDTDVNAA